MTTPSTTSESVIDLGTPVWCWAHLRAGVEGILSYSGLRGRASLAVPYAVADREIAISLASFNETGLLAAGGTVTLEVSGIGAGGLRWVVRATGEASRAALPSPTDPSSLSRSHPAHGEGWVDDFHDVRLLMTRFRLRGFYESSTAVAETAQDWA